MNKFVIYMWGICVIFIIVFGLENIVYRYMGNKGLDLEYWEILMEVCEFELKEMKV